MSCKMQRYHEFSAGDGAVTGGGCPTGGVRIEFHRGGRRDAKLPHGAASPETSSLGRGPPRTEVRAV